MAQFETERPNAGQTFRAGPRMPGRPSLAAQARIIAAYVTAIALARFVGLALWAGLGLLIGVK
jgi:hypothetical protein